MKALKCLFSESNTIISSIYYAVVVFVSVTTSLCLGDIFTSSEKILALANQEATLLDALQMHINAEYDNLKLLSGFLSERSKSVRVTSDATTRMASNHPNGAFLLIKLYAQDWHHVTTNNPKFTRYISHLTKELPNPSDFSGACAAIVRLQRVYRLKTEDMYAGNYSGYLGPALAPEDAFEIGRQAFVDGYLNESRDWMEWSIEKLSELQAMKSTDLFSATQISAKLGQAYGLLGRTYYFMNDSAKAQTIYDKGALIDTDSGDMIQLGKELRNRTSIDAYGSAVERWDNTMSELCRRDKNHRMDKMRPYHICRYKREIPTVPYLRYKEEILSISPYASLFYDIVSDNEIDVLKDFVRGKLFRGKVGVGINSTHDSSRTSDLGWIYDEDSEVATQVSWRVKSITGLEVAQRLPHGPSSSEAFQVVNYGMGGHYDMHLDPFDESPTEILLNRSGERIATFLIYLSDVEMGGNTVFIRSKISVAPKKGMALFWYNFDPKMTKDMKTYHAGCPVMVGHKWIANKWIWTYGNTFRRPCGPSPNSTQEDIEPLMYSCHQQCLRQEKLNIYQATTSK